MEYIDSLTEDERIDALSVLECIEKDEFEEIFFKRWEKKIYEVYFRKHNRIFYVTVDKENIYLLHACRKQKNQTEKENIVELKTNIYLLSIIGEVEGHESLGERTKATRYEHILPALARAEEDKSIDGLLILLNTVGGDVEAGLAIAEMIASMRKPAVSLVLGGGHSIGVPLAVAADYSLIVPSATMVIHPVRTNGMFIGVAQTYRNMEKTQDRITGFVSAHSKITKERLEELMLDTKMLVKDVGTMLDGPQAVEEGLIDEVGGIARALEKLNELMKKAAGTEN